MNSNIIQTPKIEKDYTTFGKEHYENDGDNQLNQMND